MEYNDQLIKKHLNNLAQSPHNASVKYFLETGKVNGGFAQALYDLIEEAKLDGVTEYKNLHVQ